MALWSRTRSGPRVAGAPPSSNGASSLHLRWDLDAPMRAVSVELTVEEPPTVPKLYFWALQADFVTRAGRAAGGAHLGLQWHPSHPGSTAVNWGGYRSGGGELEGSPSTLPSATGNANTVDFPWEARRTYRLAIDPTPEGSDRSGAPFTSWRGSVIDITGSNGGDRLVVRELHVPGGDAIGAALVWSEVFARCDDPAVTVRWSHPAALDADGGTVHPARAALNYQSRAEGGCANTCSFPTEDPRAPGIRQRTNCERRIPPSAVIPWS